MKTKTLITLILLLFFTNISLAQTTAFTYQGKLNDNNLPANANYDFEFRLYDAATDGTRLTSLFKSSVPVVNGAFTVQLDFGANFNGQPRFLEIAVRPAGSQSSYQQLLPRQPFTSLPYSIRSLNAATADFATNAANSSTLDGIDSSSFVQTNSTLFIRNQTGQQTVSNFNISGTGAANIFNATTQYNIGGQRVFSINGNGSIFVGVNAGAAGTGSFYNSFFGKEAGALNTGTYNSFFGYTTGASNTDGYANSFFGSSAGYSNTTGVNNSFFGSSAGIFNTTGQSNVFIGNGSGNATTEGNYNTFVGGIAGYGNTTGSRNTALGYNAGVLSDNLSYATAIGAGALVNTNNTIVLGRAADDVRIPGNLVVVTLGSAGSTDVCRNASNQLSTCSSSLRYKTGVHSFTGGLSVVRQLRPIAFQWKQGGKHDVGFAAEEVNEIEPLLTTTNEKGEIEGVKYAQISTVLVNAVKEQQQIIEQQQQQINALKQLFCELKPIATICKEK